MTLGHYFSPFDKRVYKINEPVRFDHKTNCLAKTPTHSERNLLGPLRLNTNLKNYIVSEFDTHVLMIMRK